jgi:hypothetical protein
VLKQIEEHYKRLGTEIQHVETHVHELSYETEHAGRVHSEVFHRMGEHVSILKEHWGELRENISSVGEHLAELVPAMAAFGAAASVAGIFETVAKTAESYGELVHQAGVLGTSARQLQLYGAAAKLADTNVESFQKSMAHLNLVMGQVNSGTNKDAAALFQHLHINPASYHDAIEMLPRLADAFEHTKQRLGNKAEGMESRMARALFGKQGFEQIPLLNKGGDHLRETLSEAGKLVPDLSKHGEGLERYNEALKGLGLSTGGFMDSLGGKLAPVLAPSIEQLRDYVAEHREELTDKLTKGVSTFAASLEHADWSGITHNIERVATALESVGENMRVVEVAAGIMAVSMAFKGVIFFATPIAQLVRLGVLIPATAARLTGELVTAWGGVRAAAVAAGEAQIAAVEAGAAGAGVGAAEKGVAKQVAGSRLSRAAMATVGFVSSWPVAGGIIAHELDSNDSSGKWMDGHFAWAANADDWVFRHTGGWIGRNHDENLEPVTLPVRILDGNYQQRVYDKLSPIRLVHMVPDFLKATQRDGRCKRETPEFRPLPVHVLNEDYHDRVYNKLDALKRVMVVPEHLTAASSFDLPASALARGNSYGILMPQSDDRFVLPPPPAPAATSTQGSRPMSLSDVQINIRFENAPPGMRTETNSPPGGPRVRTNLGAAWYDDLSHS